MKKWFLGGLGFVGFYKIPLVIDCFQGNESLWEANNLLWFLYFIPKSEQATLLIIKNLSKNWVFQKNTLSGFTESQSEKEINDFLNLSLNMTFTSFSEGKHESGDWEFNEKKIVLSKKNEEQNLYLIVKN